MRIVSPESCSTSGDWGLSSDEEHTGGEFTVGEHTGGELTSGTCGVVEGKMMLKGHIRHHELVHMM